MNKEKPSLSDFETRALPGLLRVLRRQIETLDVMVEVFQEGQALVPPPTPEELAGMRRGERPLTREAYLIGLYQRAIVAAEDLAADLRTAIEETTLKKIHKMKLSAIEVNCIEAGAARLRE